MISHTRRAIFVHVPKTGGQSIVRAFLREDGLRWEDRHRLEVRDNQDPALGPAVLDHMLAREHVEHRHVTPEQYRTYFKFSVVRNPWDRLVSAYKFSQERRPHLRGIPFAAFVEGRLPPDLRLARHLVPQWAFVCDTDGAMLVDAVLRFETLERDFAMVSRRMFGRPVALEHTNRSADRRDYREFYTDAAAALVAERYRHDIDRFGYRFDDATKE